MISMINLNIVFHRMHPGFDECNPTVVLVGGIWVKYKLFSFKKKSSSFTSTFSACAPNRPRTKGNRGTKTDTRHSVTNQIPHSCNYSQCILSLSLCVRSWCGCLWTHKCTQCRLSCHELPLGLAKGGIQRMINEYKWHKPTAKAPFLSLHQLAQCSPSFCENGEKRPVQQPSALKQDFLLWHFPGHCSQMENSSGFRDIGLAPSCSEVWHLVFSTYVHPSNLHVPHGTISWPCCQPALVLPSFVVSKKSLILKITSAARSAPSVAWASLVITVLGLTKRHGSFLLISLFSFPNIPQIQHSSSLPAWSTLRMVKTVSRSRIAKQLCIYIYL